MFWKFLETCFTPQFAPNPLQAEVLGPVTAGRPGPGTWGTLSAPGHLPLELRLLNQVSDRPQDCEPPPPSLELRLDPSGSLSVMRGTDGGAGWAGSGGSARSGQRDGDGQTEGRRGADRGTARGRHRAGGSRRRAEAESVDALLAAGGTLGLEPPSHSPRGRCECPHVPAFAGIQTPAPEAAGPRLCLSPPESAEPTR